MVIDSAPAVVAEESPIAKEPLDLQSALKIVLKKALLVDGLSRGLHEAAKALDKRQAHLCILANSCNEAAYSKLVTALCTEHGISLIKVPDGKQLGEWVGLCKIDKEGVARKVVNCSCVVVKDFGPHSEALEFLQNHLKAGGGDLE